MGSIWQSAQPRNSATRFPPWAWAFLAAAIFTGFIILGFSFSAWASPPGSARQSGDSEQPPVVGDIELSLGDRALLRAFVQANVPQEGPPTAQDDFQCFAQFGPASWALTVKRCFVEGALTVEAMARLCDHAKRGYTLALLRRGEDGHLRLTCRAPGKGV